MIVPSSGLRVSARPAAWSLVAGLRLSSQGHDVSELPTLTILGRVGFQFATGVAEGALAFTKRRSRVQRHPGGDVRIAAKPALSRGNVHLDEHCRRNRSTVEEGIRAFRRHCAELVFRGGAPPHRRSRSGSHTSIDFRLAGDANDHRSEDAVRPSKESRGARGMTELQTSNSELPVPGDGYEFPVPCLCTETRNPEPATITRNR